MNLSTSLSLITNRTEAGPFLSTASYLQSMQRCAQAGYRLFDWNACDFAQPAALPGGTGLLRDDWRGFVEALHRQAQCLNVGFNQAHGLVYNYFGGDERTAFLHRMEKRVLKACAELEIRRIVYHPVTPDDLRGVQDAEGCRRANRDYISCVAEQAGSLGLEIAIENMFVTRYQDGTEFWRYCSHPEELVDLVDSIGMENVKICMDVGHAHIMGENLCKMVDSFGERLATLHIHDNDGASDQHLMPFHGTIEWENLMQSLAENGYSGDLTYELHNAVIHLPQELWPGMLRETVAVGRWLIGRYEHYRASQTVCQSKNIGGES